jgi:DNA repair exonuclease SbcCD nuclease subunit
MLEWLTRQAVEHEVDAMLIAGDIFDAKHVLPRERDCFMEWLFDHDREAVKSQFLTIMIGGNHDEVESGYTHLHGLRRLMQRGILQRTIIVDVHAQCLPVQSIRNPAETAWVACLPAAGYKGDELSTVVRAFRKSLDVKAEKSRAPPRYFVVMAHEAIAGAVTETGSYRARGPTIDTSLDVTYWALGDIHKPYQQMAPNAWYSGSPIQHEFGDVSPERGALLVDLDDPCNPTCLQIDGVTPLVTLYDRPDSWPTDAIVRFEGTAEEIADTHFPGNVVAFKPLVEIENRARETVAIDLAGYAILEGLKDVLAEQAVPQERWQDVGETLRQALDACR